MDKMPQVDIEGSTQVVGWAMSVIQQRINGEETTSQHLMGGLVVHVKVTSISDGPAWSRQADAWHVVQEEISNEED